LKTIATSWRFVLIEFPLFGILLMGLYYPALYLMFRKWNTDQYNYCYLIPFVVLYLVWEKRGTLASIPSAHSWKGLVPYVFGLGLFWLGELGGEHLTQLISFWLVLIGLCWIYLGWEKLKTIGFALFFILTMFPLPYFINTRIMIQLRLISSKLGVAMIQLFGLPVSRNGNVIDLGFVKLQVVDACSGLYSLVSLVVLCLLLVYFFKDHLWKRATLLSSSVVLAIFSNSLRIAVTAILHKYYGSEVAEGFFHGFSGLLIFLLCVPILFIEMKILERLPPKIKKSSSDHSDSDKHFSKSKTHPDGGKVSSGAITRHLIFIVPVILLVLTIVFSQAVEFREKIPTKKSLDQLPLKVADWTAKERQLIDKVFLDKLDLSEYMVADYENSKGKRISFYVAYYESQVEGKSIHSPETCLPASGWNFKQYSPVSISAIPDMPGKMKISRALLEYGESRQIAYFWFSQRGRILTSLYQLKLYNFWDALILQRTDGALVRLITPVYESENVADAEARLQNFVRDIVPVLNEYIPGKNIGDSS
jgi:exosortase D (VPLPA-CTERM-specific)